MNAESRTRYQWFKYGGQQYFRIFCGRNVAGPVISRINIQYWYGMGILCTHNISTNGNTVSYCRCCPSLRTEASRPVLNCQRRDQRRRPLQLWAYHVALGRTMCATVPTFNARTIQPFKHGITCDRKQRAWHSQN
jgi:hypothetical protein